MGTDWIIIPGSPADNSYSATLPLNVYGTNWKRGVISKEPVTAMQEMKCVHYWSKAGTFRTNPLCVLIGIAQLICKSRWSWRWQMADCTDCCSRQRGNLCPADHLAFHAVTNMLIKGTKCMFSLWAEHGYYVTEITLKYLYLSIYPIRVDGLSIHSCQNMQTWQWLPLLQHLYRNLVF